VADFVGGDRSLRRLAVTPVDLNMLAPLSDLSLSKTDDIPTIPVKSSLKDALAVLLAGDTGWVAVRDGSQTLGVLSPQALHQTLRHALPPEASSVDD
jgi:osmoprotectant transport system ATP-binding protein